MEDLGYNVNDKTDGLLQEKTLSMKGLFSLVQMVEVMRIELMPLG